MKLKSVKLYDWDFITTRLPRSYVPDREGPRNRTRGCISPKIALNNSYQVRYSHYMVPMIELQDGTQIGEALAIWTYLETLYPQPALMGGMALERAVISAWERRAYDEGMVGHAEIFRNSHPNFVDRGLPGHREPVPRIPALIDRGELGRPIGDKSSMAGAQNRFVAGDKFSVADITTITVVDFGHAFWRCRIPDDCPHVKRWYDEMQQRDSVRGSLPTHLPRRIADGACGLTAIAGGAFTTPFSRPVAVHREL